MGNELKSDTLNIGSKGQHDLRKTIVRMLKDGKKGKEIGSSRKVGGLLNIKAGQPNFRERINAENAHLSFITVPLMAKL